MEEAQPIGTEPTDPPAPRGRWLSCLGCITLAGLAVMLLASILVPGFIKAPNQGQLTACKSNLKNIATGLEMYATDNGGRYPASLSLIEARVYLKKIPTCAAAGKQTYVYSVQEKPDAFTLYCQGDHHQKAMSGFGLDSTNFPQYTAEHGLRDHP